MPIANQPRSDFSDQLPPLELSEPHAPKARLALVSRLCELVSWPESRIPAYERQLAADILVGLLRASSLELRQRCAHGLARISDAPKALLRYLARDEISVAGPLLEAGVGFDDSDLIATIRAGVTPHWVAIAKRRGLTEPVTDALIQTGEVSVIEAVLRNQFAKLSMQGVDVVVARSRQAASLPKLLVARTELRPTQALVLFWWASFESRVQILRRFAVDRTALILELGDVFKMAAAEGWADARKALQVVERRQRNRAAAAQSPYGSLEGALAAAEHGLDKHLLHEIAHLAGIKPTTAQQIFTDVGGEAIGVLCKAVGLKRPLFLALWRALRRPNGDPDSTDNSLGRAAYVFDTLATAKAQTVVRYWNWSFTADAVELQRVSFEDDTLDLSLARRNAALLFGRNG
jgi:uncharacterized protein (DUF2336 family)